MPNNENLKSYTDNEKTLMSQFFDSYGNINYQFTKGRCFYDGTATLSDNTTILFETKVRNFSMSTYPTYIVEKQKFSNLVNQRFNYDKILYFNFFTNGDTYDLIIFDLDNRIKQFKQQNLDINHYTQVKYMNKQTFKSTTNKTKKEILMLEYKPDIDSMFTNTNFST